MVITVGKLVAGLFHKDSGITLNQHYKAESQVIPIRIDGGYGKRQVIYMRNDVHCQPCSKVIRNGDSKKSGEVESLRIKTLIVPEDSGGQNCFKRPGPAQVGVRRERDIDRLCFTRRKEQRTLHAIMSSSKHNWPSTELDHALDG